MRKMRTEEYKGGSRVRQSGVRRVWMFEKGGTLFTLFCSMMLDAGTGGHMVRMDPVLEAACVVPELTLE